jgi:methylmalonyl-CoA mutase cobalamin-binding domain/chain
MGELADALRDLDENKVYDLIDQKIDQGVSALDIIDECNAGMVAVGELFSDNTYFLSQLMFSANILKTVMERLEPILEGTQKRDAIGKVVIGTVNGDIHDIGKNIVITLLRGTGFEVIDLGVSVPAEKFVEAIKESGAVVLGLSALLSTTYPEMKNVVGAVNKAGLREQVKIIIGGAPVNEQVRQFTGADYYADSAVTGINLCKDICNGNRRLK